VSCDERSSSSFKGSLQSPLLVCRNDPTIEATLTSSQDDTKNSQLTVETLQKTKVLVFGKRRSASCGTLSGLVNGGICETIAEDSTFTGTKHDDDHQAFSMTEEMGEGGAIMST